MSADLLGWRGIQAADTLVFCGAFTDMCAARGFWFAEYLGHTDVHVLDGGLAGWTQAGGPLTVAGEPPTATRFEYCADPTRIATRRSVLEAIDDPNCVIVDNRSREEFQGTDRRARHGGAIPNARHCDWVNLYEPDTGRMKSGDELRSIFDAIGVTPDKDITVYCNTGYRSAHAYLALRLLGFPRVRNYVGSWQEWGNREGVPITRGGSRYP